MATKTFLDLPGGIKMPSLGLGTWMTTDEKELEDALNTALEVGYRHFDTAFSYKNEKMIGNVLKKWFDSGKVKREDLFITTKLPMYGVHPLRVEFFLKKSLENLQLDYVDLYLVHSPICFKFDPESSQTMEEQFAVKIPEPKTDHVGVWKEMEKQVDAGRTRTIGLSNYNISQIQNVLESARIKPANLQVEIHVFLQQPDLVDFCHKSGITVVAYAPLGTPGYNNLMAQLGLKQKELPNILTNSVVNKIAKKHSKTSAQVALRYLLQLGLAAIPKSVNANRIKENFHVFDFRLDENDLKELKNLDQNHRVCGFVDFLPSINGHPDFPF